MKFSLVIPVAPDRGAEILESIKKMDYPKKKFQIIVINGRNPSDNRNKGFEKSKGEIIVFLDDDAVIREDYLKKVEDFFKKHPEVDIVGGPQLTPHDDKGFAKISGYALSSKFGAWKIANRYSVRKEVLNTDETALTSANLICKRKVLEKVKFDLNLFPGEDPKFISDCKKLGFKVAYSPEMVIYHRRRPTIKLLTKQIFNYGKVRPLKEGIFETIKKPYFLIPSIFLVYLIVLLASIFIGTSGWFFAPLIFYFFLALMFSAYDSAKNDDLKSIFILPFIYFIIHVSYGYGMIYSYFKKMF